MPVPNPLIRRLAIIRSHSLRFAAPLLLVLASATTSALPVETVAITGGAAPGGGDYLGFGQPVLNASGQVAFTATLQGSGVDDSNDLGLWSGSPGALEIVARRGAEAPDTGGASFRSFVSPPVLNDAGRASFRAFLAANGAIDGSNDEGIFSNVGGSLEAIALEGSAGHGVPSGELHASNLGAPAFDAAGRIAYHGSLLGGGTTAADNRALWFSGSQASPVALVARKGLPAPFAGDGSRFESFDAPVLNDQGALAFRARLDNGNDGIWTGSNGGLALVARRGNAAPGITGAQFERFQVPDLDDNGSLGFAATLAPGAGGVGADNDTGIWVGDPNGLALVAREGDPAGGGSFQSFFPPQASGAGSVVFRARTSAGSGVFAGNENAVVAIATSGQIAVGSDPGVNFAALLDPVSNGLGQLAFASFLAGPGVTVNNDEALYVRRGAGEPLELAVREGDAFERAPGDSALVDELRIVTGPRSTGRSLAEADGGQLALWLRFDDGGEGIFLLPEPTAPAGFFACALGLLLLADRRRRKLDARARLCALAFCVITLSFAPALHADVIEAENGDRCDFLDAAHCLLPWPSSHYVAADGNTDTGERLNLNLLSMPSNIGGVPIQPADYNRNDGWSPGQMILVVVPGIDLQASGAPLITDLERSLHHDSATVIVNATTGEKHLHWAELDYHATADATRSLILRPGVNFDEDQRYVVAIRRAVGRDGRRLPPSPAFEAYRDALPTGMPEVEARRAQMEENFAVLERAGVERSDLYLAWDFHTASERNLSERVLHMRDEAFVELGASSPSFQILDVTDDFSANVYRHVQGTYLVPRYLNSSGPGGRMTFENLQGQGPELPDRYPGDQQAVFECIIPRSATATGADPVVPARPSTYGHGLLGDASQVTAGHVQAMANENNFVFCATDWIGMSTPDLAIIFGTIIPDLSHFGTIPERGQQSFLNFLYLARLMTHANGFASDPAFQAGTGNASVIDPSEVYYDGNSQGGIMGGGLMAVSQEMTKGVLGVPAMNYSTLLRRSVDFAPFKEVLDQNYTNEIERAMVLSLIQLLWDRGEANGYAHHLTDDPLPNTPPHQVLLHEAFGDHQVANVATEVEARTIGAQLYTPATNPGRHTDLYPFDGIDPIPAYPHPGSALVVWDSVPLRRPVEPPPTENRPPDEETGNQDPHSDPRNDSDGRAQKGRFLSPAGGVIDVCAAAACLADE